MITILAMLAVYRLTYMLQDEAGPFGVFARLQAWVARRPDNPGSLADGFFCFYCSSMWIALPFALLLSFDRFFIIYWFALSTGAIATYHLIETVKNK